MYFDRVQVKREAKAIIRTARPSPVFVTLIFILLTSVLEEVVALFLTNPFSQALSYLQAGYRPMEVYAYVFGGTAILGLFVSVLLMFYNTVMSYGYASYTLRLSRYEESGVGNLLEGFNLAAKVVALNLLISLFTVLWSMLFLFPGIVAAYSYSQAVYCLLDDPEIGVLEAIRRSKLMMRGQKFNLFVLQLSFIGWELLVSAIGWVMMSGLSLLNTSLAYWVSSLVIWLFNLWLMPYMNITFAGFYNHLIGWGRRSEEENANPRVEF